MAWLLSSCVFLLAPLGAAAASCYDGQGGFTQEQWSFCQKLSDKILMYYGPSGDFVKMGLFVSQHAGWSALAFGGNGGMKGAQQFVVRKVDGSFVAEERYSSNYATPELQATQEVALLFANEENGNIAWGVVVPKTSCAYGDRYPVEDMSRFMHWALGSTHDFYHHSSRGQFHANLISGPSTMQDFSSAANISITMPDVSVVMGAGGNDEKNPYICSIFDISQMLPSGMSVDAKHHVAMFSPILDADSAAYVHHMILYGCEDEDALSGLTHGQVIPECESMPNGCNALKWPWAVGSEPVIFPAEAGMPMGQGKRWYALQMHYYNPSLDTGIKDNSGVRVTFANALRTHDAATFQFNGGTNNGQRDMIPSGQAAYTLPKAIVPSHCTNQWSGDVNIVGVIYHAHLVGKSLNIDVIRNGALLGDLRREKLYDFNHQSLEPSSINKLKKGDELILSCTYDTTARTAPTGFGDFTQTEMCWSAFMYYPAQSMNHAYLTRRNGKNAMHCFGGWNSGPHEFAEPTIPTRSCVPQGDFHSTAGQQALAAMGVNVSSIQSTTTTSSSANVIDSSISSSVNAIAGLAALMVLTQVLA